MLKSKAHCPIQFFPDQKDLGTGHLSGFFFVLFFFTLGMPSASAQSLNIGMEFGLLSPFLLEYQVFVGQCSPKAHCTGR